MIQRMPPEGAVDSSWRDTLEEWRRARVLAGTCATEELLDPDLAPRSLLRRLFHEDGVRVYPPQPLPAQPDFPANFPRVWLRLNRRGDTFTASYSGDGGTWRTFTVHRQALPAAA